MELLAEDRRKVCQNKPKLCVFYPPISPSPVPAAATAAATSGGSHITCRSERTDAARRYSTSRNTNVQRRQRDLGRQTLCCTMKENSQTVREVHFTNSLTETVCFMRGRAADTGCRCSWWSPQRSRRSPAKVTELTRASSRSTDALKKNTRRGNTSSVSAETAACPSPTARARAAAQRPAVCP